MSTGETWTLGHRPALDGLRGIAVLLVLASHLRLPGSGISGAVGVVVFFTLSGFLITTLLLDRPEPLRRFYLRRGARLVPALLACVLLWVGLQLALSGAVRDGRDIAATLTYTSNWLYAGVSTSPESGIAHTWSLSVEEQFYLLWPPVLLLLVRLPRRWAVMAVAVLVFASFSARVDAYAAQGYMPAYYRFDARAGELLIGCALAMLMRGRREREAWAWPAVLALCGVAALSLSGGPFASLLMPTLAALAAAVVLYVAVNGAQVWLSPRWLVWVGRRSYGIYLYHFPLLWAVEQYGAPWWVAAPVTLGLALGLAEVSWRFVEQPFLRPSGLGSVSGQPPTPLASKCAATRAADSWVA